MGPAGPDRTKSADFAGDPRGPSGLMSGRVRSGQSSGIHLSQSKSFFFKKATGRFTTFTDAARIARGRVYVTVRCPSVHLSMCLSQLSTVACRCGEFAAVGQVGTRYRSIAAAKGAASARHLVANASSVTLSTDVGS